MWILLSATDKPTTISGAVVALLLAMAAAIPLLLRLYFKDRRRQRKMSHRIDVKEIALKQKELELREREMKQRLAIEKKESAQRMAIEKKESAQRLAMEKQGMQAVPIAMQTEAVDVVTEEKTRRIEEVADIELFRQKAIRLGCREDMSLGEMAQVVLKYAPAAMLSELPDSLSDEDKAVEVLGAFKQQPKAIEQQGGEGTCGGNESS